MDLRPSFSSAQDAFGTDATVLVPDGDPVETVVVWLPPITVDHPVGAEFTRAEAKHVMGVPIDDVPLLPRETIITCPEQSGGEAVDWSVDETMQIDADHHRVLVTRVEE